MPIEHAFTQVVDKPWGSTDLRPWSDVHHDDGAAIGEIWFERADVSAPPPALLLKLLFTTEPLSIQVHPDDAFAQSIGMANGKNEAWYILSAKPGAQVAIGLTRQLTPAELRAAIEDRSIARLVQWRSVQKDDVISVPAGTIHAIGAGLVLAEIQQRSNATFRLFDHGRPRELHVDNAVAAANAGPPQEQTPPSSLDEGRTLLVANPHFVLERLDLPPRSAWTLRAEDETWLLVLDGHARIGTTDAFVGEAVFLEADNASIDVGSRGLRCLLCYPGPEPHRKLLRKADARKAGSPIRHVSRSPLFHHPRAGSPARKPETRA